MDYRKAQGVTNKIHSWLLVIAGIGVFLGVLNIMAGAWSTGIIALIVGGLSTAAAGKVGQRTRRYFDLANIQGLIKAEGMSTGQRRRMAMRIYKTNK